MKVEIRWDLFAGHPYLSAWVWKGGEDLHHATEAARMRRLARKIWGDKADVIRHAQGNYTMVWCGINEPIPEFFGDKRYGVNHFDA